MTEHDCCGRPPIGTATRRQGNSCSMDGSDTPDTYLEAEPVVPTTTDSKTRHFLRRAYVLCVLHFARQHRQLLKCSVYAYPNGTTARERPLLARRLDLNLCHDWIVSHPGAVVLLNCFIFMMYLQTDGYKGTFCFGCSPPLQ